MFACHLDVGVFVSEQLCRVRALRVDRGEGHVVEGQGVVGGGRISGGEAPGERPEAQQV